MLLAPLATGAVVASRIAFNAGALTLFVVATMAFFWLRTPFEAWLGTSPIKAQTGEERASVLQAVVALAALGILCIAFLFAKGYGRGLLLIGAVAAAAFAAQALVKRVGRAGRMPAQIIGAIGLTSTAAGAYYVASGRFDATAITLWVANWLFAAEQIHYVQIRIRGSRATTFADKMKRGYAFALGQLVLVLALILAVRFARVSWILLLAFLPAIARGTYWFFNGARPLNVHKLGFSELAQALVFGVLLSAAFLI
jgi:hypothetical protein